MTAIGEPVERRSDDCYVAHPVVEISVRGTTQLAPPLVAAALVLFAILYVFVISNPRLPTAARGLADDDIRVGARRPGSFALILLDAVTFAGLLFIVASGFSLIFGLMRMVNMAHGSFSYSPADRLRGPAAVTGEGGSRSRASTCRPGSGCPVLVAAAMVSVVGLVVQQTFLRWNRPGPPPGAAQDRVW